MARRDAVRNHQAVLKALPGTRAQIAKRTGLSPQAAARWTAYMVERNEAHVSEYVLVGVHRWSSAVYSAGPCEGAPLVDPGIERRLHRAAQRQAKQEARRAERVLAEAQRAAWVRQPVRQHDPLMTAFFGM